MVGSGAVRGEPPRPGADGVFGCAPDVKARFARDST